MSKRFQWHAALALACACTLAQARDGDLDAGFGTGGIAILDFGMPAYAEGIAIAPDGRIVLAGHVWGGLASQSDVALARLLANGAPDTDFSGDGRLVLASSGATNETALDALVQADGRVVLAGYSDAAGNNDMQALRLTADGTPDTSFGGSGSVAIPFDLGNDNSDLALAVAEDADGRLVVVGSAGVNDGIDQQHDVAVARLNADGSLDASFNGSGKTTFRFNPDALAYFDDDYGTCLAIDPAGNLLVGGYVFDGHTGDKDFAVARLLPSGAIDTSFGEGGRARIDFALGGPGDQVSRVLVAADGAIYLVGDAYYQNSYVRMAIARLTPEGALDASWGSGGKTTISIPSDDDDSTQASAAVLQPDGKLVVAGTARNGGGHFRFAFARLDAGGQLDASFGDGGKLAFGLVSVPSQWNEIVSDLRIDAEGHLVFTGYSWTQPGFISGRLVIDTIFDDGFEP